MKNLILLDAQMEENKSMQTPHTYGILLKQFYGDSTNLIRNQLIKTAYFPFSSNWKVLY